MAAKVKHLIGTNIVSLLPYYSGTDNNVNVATITGVTPIVAGTTQLPTTTSIATTGALQKNGVIRPFKVRVAPASTGSGTVTTKVHKMYCATANAPNIGQLIGGTFTQGYTIVDAWIPEHFTYGA